MKVEVILMSKSNKKNANELPIFGKDIIDDWSWDCIEKKCVKNLNQMWIVFLNQKK